MQPRKLVLHMKRLNQTGSVMRDFMCSLFPKAILYDLFYSPIAGVVPRGGRKKSPRISSKCRLLAHLSTKCSW